MRNLVTLEAFNEYDHTGVAPYLNDYTTKRLVSTVSGNEVIFSDPLITSNNTTIEGPYIEDVVLGVDSIIFGENSITYKLSSSEADSKHAILWIRY